MIKTSLPKRRKSNHTHNGVENHKKTAYISITSNGSIKNKGKEEKKFFFVDLTDLTHKMPCEEQLCFTVKGITLTSTLRDILMNEQGWFTS